MEPALELPSRHLGLLPPGELADLERREEQWAHLAERHLDLERLWPLLAAPAMAAGEGDPIRWCLRGRAAPAADLPAVGSRLPVAIASDRAFHFRYPEAEELLEALGLSPIPWSPLADEPLPEGCRGVVLPGAIPNSMRLPWRRPAAASRICAGRPAPVFPLWRNAAGCCCWGRA